MKKHFTTINEIKDEVRFALGEFANDYDIEQIAREISDWENGFMVVVVEDDDFWAIVQSNELTK